MTNTGDFGQSAHQVNQRSMSFMALPPQALEGVRTRRIMAVCLDLLLVSLISSVLFLGSIIMTLGLSLLFLPSLFPLVAFFYNGMTISGWRRATPGMRAMDLEVRMTDGAHVPFLNAAMQGLLFWLSVYVSGGLLLLVSLVTKDKRCLHDIFSGVVVVRRFN